MKPVLGREGMKRLRAFAGARVAVVLDYDGTISPIARKVNAAVIPPRRKRLLRRLSRLYPTAALSGRKLSDVAARVRGCGFAMSVGNHGLEWTGARASVRYEKLMRRCKRRIDDAIRGGEIHGQGIEVENKKVTLSIHYRQSRNRARAHREILAALRHLPGTQIIEGKQVFNLLPRTRLNKGTAVLSLRKKLRCPRIIYLGDDWTDEKVFALSPKPFLLDVRVGRSSRSRARYYLPDISSIDAFLRELIRLRTRAERA